MGALEDLAKTLSDTKRIGLNEELVKKLRIVDEELTLTRLKAQIDDTRPHRAIHMIGAYVENDTDLIGKGEIYWWSVPMLGEASGKITWNPLIGLPNGAPPHRCGDHEWMTNVSLADPPLLALVPPGDDIAAAIVHVAFYDDDWEPAKLEPAMSAGLEALAGTKMPVADPDALIAPIKKAIFESLKAKRDDLMMERQLRFLREDGKGYGAGTIGSALTEFVRIYWIVRDVVKTEKIGPFNLQKGLEQRILPPSGLEGGGFLAIFARGGPVRADPFGTLDSEKPFLNVAIESRHEKSLAAGVTLVAEKEADVVAYYTPPETGPRG